MYENYRKNAINNKIYYKKILICSKFIYKIAQFIKLIKLIH